MTKSFDAIIALGSNMGDKVGALGDATARLEAHGEIDVLGRSKLYRTEAWGEENQDWFVNACLGVATTLGPLALLHTCQDIENQLGRVREKRWGPRAIDLDILVYRNVVQREAELTLPHPLITERAFVLVPLNDIAPQQVLQGKAVSAWVHEIDTSGVVELDPFKVSAQPK